MFDSHKRSFSLAVDSVFVCTEACSLTHQLYSCKWSIGPLRYTLINVKRILFSLPQKKLLLHKDFSKTSLHVGLQKKGYIVSRLMLRLNNEKVLLVYHQRNLEELFKFWVTVMVYDGR